MPQTFVLVTMSKSDPEKEITVLSWIFLKSNEHQKKLLAFISHSHLSNCVYLRESV